MSSIYIIAIIRKVAFSLLIRSLSLIKNVSTKLIKKIEIHNAKSKMKSLYFSQISYTSSLTLKYLCSTRKNIPIKKSIDVMEIMSS